MDEIIENPIEIREGFFGHDSINIVPVKKGAGLLSESYEEKEDEEISISCYYLEGYIGSLLSKYYSSETQIDKAPWQTGYDEYGWNYYTPEQITSILKELEVHARTMPSDTSDSIRVKDFYVRFITRMNKMLQNLDGYDLILFSGP